MHAAEAKYVTKQESAMAVSRTCALCGFTQLRKKRPGVGRGNGMREGNKQRGVLIQHLKTAHPTEYAEAMSIGR